MVSYFRYLSVGSVLLALLGGASFAGWLRTSALAQTTFPDVPADYWAGPFIRALAQEEIVTGYPDGTYRPEQPLARDEFAALVRKAFEQEQERSIPSGSVFEDVPEGYWAEVPIEEAYETGFIGKTSEDTFSPKQPVSKVEAIAALARGLDALSPSNTASSQNQTAQTTRQQAQNHFAFPLASTVLMAPFVQPRVSNGSSTPAATSQAEPPVAAKVNQYYEDADRIPENAVDEVASATNRGIVVNYPDREVLNPNEILNRGAAAALVHQALVSLDRLPPLQDEVEASQYIVTPNLIQ